jgi:hypothetical protein
MCSTGTCCHVDCFPLQRGFCSYFRRILRSFAAVSYDDRSTTDHIADAVIERTPNPRGGQRQAGASRSAMRLCLMLLAILSPTSTGFNSNWMSLRRYDRHSALVNARRRRQEVLEASFLPRPRTGSRDEGDIDVVSPRLLNGPQPSEAGQGVVHPSSDFRSRGAIGEQALFRHRFLCSSDMCIRMPVEGSELLRAFVMHSHLAGVIHLQVEAFRPLSRVRWVRGNA